MQVYDAEKQAHRWIDHMFAAKSARRGSVVRRSRAWVDREVGRSLFEAEVRRRGYHLIETADQFIVVCHNGPIRILF
ncbi:MAG: N-(5'-phosphoribosyl)anthranilate isomerase [Rhodobacteraceae bacterium CG17_big_fil_post_rev_8_21_14_2_50_65_11]|nr:MAG: N-(5'-phosphoribosyl)anthranilate isomerase [Rhodobacteraceae bacterium CG17_big_fil_post_rev_8_21_14_2_50_65_11]